ncbi:unnamed protein product [Coffea canephora]|uniref:Uncharacterized protein n=1 Tax=Coffea canephora TaxID=49390 RepID=A0A068UT15_COFCA|nr:unnamed protein product [Coffea canephora]
MYTPTYLSTPKKQPCNHSCRLFFLHFARYPDTLHPHQRPGKQTVHKLLISANSGLQDIPWLID